MEIFITYLAICNMLFRSNWTKLKSGFASSPVSNPSNGFLFYFGTCALYFEKGEDEQFNVENISHQHRNDRQ